MVTPPAPRRPNPPAGIAHALREAFWPIALGLIAGYAFLAALGAFTPGDVIAVTVAIGVLVVLWLTHAWTAGHRPDAARDPRRPAARDRRGV